MDTCPAGNDIFAKTYASIGIDLNLDGCCLTDTVLALSGPTTIVRQAGTPHTINTEIISMVLTDDGVPGPPGITLRAGTGSGSVNPLPASKGMIVEKGDTVTALSYFDVFFEIQLSEIGRAHV